MADCGKRADSIGFRTTLSGLSLSLLIGVIAPPQSMAIFSSKKSSLQLPVNEKIELESVEETSEETTPKEESKSENKTLDLSPLSLGEESSKSEKSDKTPEDEDSGEGVIKGTIRTSQFVPKSPLEGTDKTVLAPTSVKGSKSKSVKSLGGKLVDQAATVNAAPLPLVASKEETVNKVDSKRELEKQQLTALWEATLTRSPDINFVLQKLMPASDSSRVTSLMMRALSSAMYSGLGVLGAMSPGPTTYMAQNLGYSAISQLLQLQDSRDQKKARVTQIEAIMLYKMVRNTADKLVEKYRDYKKENHTLLRANSDFQDLQKMARDAREGQDASEQLEIEYTLRKAQREIEKIEQTVSKHRQGLVDLAGMQAILKLDKEIDNEIQQLYPELLNNGIAQDNVQVASDTSSSNSDKEKIAEETENKQL